MGIIDSKTTILDIQITEKGRQLLSEGNLEFSYYCFSDEDINYSGSLAIVNNPATIPSSSLDNYLHRNLSFEADQKKSYNKEEPIDMKTFLYTITTTSKTIPDFKISESGSITLKRTNKTIQSHELVKLNTLKDNAQNFILRYFKEDKNIQQVNLDYIDEQIKKDVGK